MIAVYNIKNLRREKIFPKRWKLRWRKQKTRNVLFYHLKQSLRGETFSIYSLLYENIALAHDNLKAFLYIFFMKNLQSLENLRSY